MPSSLPLHKYCGPLLAGLNEFTKVWWPFNFRTRTPASVSQTAKVLSVEQVKHKLQELKKKKKKSIKILQEFTRNKKLFALWFYLLSREVINHGWNKIKPKKKYSNSAKYISWTYSPSVENCSSITAPVWPLRMAKFSHSP